jgi:acetate kinase
MDMLVVNCGSSSVKAAVIDAESGKRSKDLRIDGIGGASCPDHAVALQQIFNQLQTEVGRIVAVGHRIVHGGEKFTQPMLIDAAVEAAIEALVPLAPLHNPAGLAGIRAARKLLPAVPHVAVFDTSFHATLPQRARAYALPAGLVGKHGIRRYGFHGISHEYLAQRAAAFLQTDIRTLRVITCHLGNGCSVTAVEYGRSVETTMGMTPLEGLVMGTRSGDVDPGVLIELARAEDLSADDLDKILNQQSGLLGMTGTNDMRDIEARATAGDAAARLAINVFTHRIRKYIGAYVAVMGGVDAIVFGGGIGEHSALIRHRVAQRLDFLGASIDEDRNRDAHVGTTSEVAEISTTHSRTRLLVVATDEERLIAQRTAQLIGQRPLTNPDHIVPIAVSARHVHLAQDVVEQLFGKGYQLTPDKPLSQPGQYAARETVTLVGPKHSIEHVRVLGPPRTETQVEISRTDEFCLGVDAPVRPSGDLDNTPGITLVGAKGRVTLQKGVICALRHIHMTPQDAATWGVQDRDLVDIAVSGTGRNVEFRDVLIRISPDFKLEMHLDTDEANAASVTSGASGVLVRIAGH